MRSRTVRAYAFLTSFPLENEERSVHVRHPSDPFGAVEHRRSARPVRSAADLSVVSAMYQLASDCRLVDKTRLFVQTCTSMVPSADNLRLVRSAAKLVRGVLDGADMGALREFIGCAAKACDNIDDVIAAAGQTAIDELQDLSRIRLHDVIRRVAEIERDALVSVARRDMEGNLRTAYAS